MSRFSRRHALATGAGAAVGIGAFGASTGTAAASPTASSRTGGREEARTLDELYRAALAEGGKPVVCAGGDTSTQQDGTRAAFRDRFPEIDLTLIVDYSKHHDVRLDNRFATDTVVPDAVSFPTRPCRGRALEADLRAALRRGPGHPDARPSRTAPGRLRGVVAADRRSGRPTATTSISSRGPRVRGPAGRRLPEQGHDRYGGGRDPGEGRSGRE